MSTLTFLGPVSNNTTGKLSSLGSSQGPWCQRENALKVHFLKQVFPRSPCSCLSLQPSRVFLEEEKSVVVGRQCLQEAAQWALFLLTVWFASRITQLWRIRRAGALVCDPIKGWGDHLWLQDYRRNGTTVCKMPLSMRYAAFMLWRLQHEGVAGQSWPTFQNPWVWCSASTPLFSTSQDTWHIYERPFSEAVNLARRQSPFSKNVTRQFSQ